MVLAAALLVGTGVYGLGFWLLSDRGPDPSAFEPAARIVRQGSQPGDLILLAPAYATRAREYLGDLHPLAVRDPLAEDYEVRRRVWVFALFGAGAPVGRGLQRLGFVPQLRHQSEGISVLRYDRAPRAEVTFDFVDAIAQARVSLERGTAREPCDQWRRTNGQGGAFGRWSCPTDPSWQYVAPEWHRMGDHLRWCLWAHPPHEGHLVIRYPRIALDGAIVGRAGHTLNSSRYARAPVFLDVSWDGVPAQRFTFGLEDHFRPFRVAVPTATTATVSFAVSSPDAGANHFCFVADLRRPAGADR